MATTGGVLAAPGGVHGLPPERRARKVGRQPRTTVPCQVPGCNTELIDING